MRESPNRIRLGAIVRRVVQEAIVSVSEPAQRKLIATSIERQIAREFASMTNAEFAKKYERYNHE
jgi:hypothetical protein